MTVSSPPPLSRRAERIAAARRDLADGAARRRAADLDCARALATLEELDALRLDGCASVGELGERQGLSAPETRDLLDLGRGLPLVPGLEEHVRAGRIPSASGGCLGRVWHGGLHREGDDWLGWAQRESTSTLRKRVWRRLDEVQAGEHLLPLRLHVRPAGMDMFQRARRVACRKAGRALSGGMALEMLSEHYVDSFDPLSRKPGERRVGDTTYVRGRYVPMEVKREVYARQNGRCAVPFCEHVLFLEYAHVVWHASGGSREAENILLFCTPHHLAFDAREFRLVGTAAAPRFLDRLGRPLDERRGNEYEPPYVAALLHRPRGRLLPRTLGEELDILEGFEPGLDVPLDALGDVRVKRRPPRP